MVFQLITFFMLVLNFKAAELDLNLQLPVITSAKPLPEGGSKLKLLVLNVELPRSAPVRVAMAWHAPPRARRGQAGYRIELVCEHGHTSHPGAEKYAISTARPA